MKKLGNLIADRWIQGESDGVPLHHAIDGSPIAIADSAGIDVEMACTFAREVGGPALRKMTFQERGRMLKRLALHLHEKEKTFTKSVGPQGPPAPIPGLTSREASATCSPMQA